MTDIEQLIHTDALPVNMKAMANRLYEILNEGGTNNYVDLKEEEKVKFRKCLWLVNAFVHGQVGKIDMQMEWEELDKINKSGQ